MCDPLTRHWIANNIFLVMGNFIMVCIQENIEPVNFHCLDNYFGEIDLLLEEMQAFSSF